MTSQIKVVVTLVDVEKRRLNKRPYFRKINVHAWGFKDLKNQVDARRKFGEQIENIQFKNGL